MDSSDTPQTLRSLFEEAESKRHAVESSHESTTSPAYAAGVESAVALYARTLEQISAASLFSPNEGVDDVPTSELPLLLAHFRLAELVQRLPRPQPRERAAVLRRARLSYEAFLDLADAYGLVADPAHARLLERYRDGDPDAFSAVPAGAGAEARRDAKIASFRAERELRDRLQALRRNPRYLETGDDEVVRELHLTDVAFCVHSTFNALDSISRELDLLKQAPEQPESSRRRPDDAAADADSDDHSLRLDQPLRQRIGNPGPLLSKEGRPLQPFTLLGSNSRPELARGVFRPGHNLPTMSIDEYLDEERRRGNIIEGGEEPRPVVDEDDMDAADRETYKAREWDEFKDHNPKGSGNTMNMG